MSPKCEVAIECLLSLETFFLLCFWFLVSGPQLAVLRYHSGDCTVLGFEHGWVICKANAFLSHCTVFLAPRSCFNLSCLGQSMGKQSIMLWVLVWIYWAQGVLRRVAGKGCWQLWSMKHAGQGYMAIWRPAISLQNGVNQAPGRQVYG